MKKRMKSEKIEKKYTPEISTKEIEELRNSIKAASQKIMAENIERMKKLILTDLKS